MIMGQFVQDQKFQCIRVGVPGTVAPPLPRLSQTPPQWKTQTLCSFATTVMVWVLEALWGSHQGRSAKSCGSKVVAMGQKCVIS